MIFDCFVQKIKLTWRITFLFIIFPCFIHAQNLAPKKLANIASTKIVHLLNINQLDSAYSIVQTAFAFKNAYDFKTFVKESIRPYLPFNQCTLITSQGALSKFKLVGKDTLAMYIGLGRTNEVEKFYFETYEKHKDLNLTGDKALRRDLFARKVLGFINEKKLDSIYNYLGASLQELGKYKWDNLFREYFFLKTPEEFAQLIAYQENKNQYRIGNYLFTVEFNKDDKIVDLQLNLDFQGVSTNDDVVGHN